MAGDAYNRSVPWQFTRMGDSMIFIVITLCSSLDHSCTRAAAAAAATTTKITATKMT
jgi:hypothetical protein